MSSVTVKLNIMTRNRFDDDDVTGCRDDELGLNYSEISKTKQEDANK